MRPPPMVGVPALVRWVSGPSSRTTCPTWCCCSLRIMSGPIRSDSPSAVTVLTTVRNVRYSNTENRLTYSARKLVKASSI